LTNSHEECSTSPVSLMPFIWTAVIALGLFGAFKEYRSRHRTAVRQPRLKRQDPLTQCTCLLALAIIWIAALPLFCLMLLAPPAETIQGFREFGATLPTGTSFILHIMSNWVLLGVLCAASALLGLLQILTFSRRKRIFTQFVTVVGIQIGLFIILVGLVLPCFKMGEVVSSGRGDGQRDILFRNDPQLEQALDSIFDDWLGSTNSLAYDCLPPESKPDHVYFDTSYLGRNYLPRVPGIKTITHNKRKPEEHKKDDIVITLSFCKRVSARSYVVSFSHSLWPVTDGCRVKYRVSFRDGKPTAKMTSYYAIQD
jgi:hypothetical protein